MIAPISSISTKNIYFSARKNPNDIKPKFEQPLHSTKELKTEKDRSFLTGALCSAVILLGVNEINNINRESFIHNMDTYINHTDMNTKNIKVIDATGDDIPDIIIEDKDGSKDIFDIKNSHQYYQDEYEFEKIM